MSEEEEYKRNRRKSGKKRPTDAKEPKQIARNSRAPMKSQSPTKR